MEQCLEMLDSSKFLGVNRRIKMTITIPTSKLSYEESPFGFAGDYKESVTNMRGAETKLSEEAEEYVVYIRE